MPLLANGYAARFFLAACNGVGRSLQAAFVAVVFSVAPASVHIARLMAGSEITETSVNAAQEMKDLAGKYKNENR